MTNEQSAENPLGSIINEKLSSIEFVLDYYQFRFGGPTLTVISNPELIVNGISYTRESDKFCNLLIKCIGHIVTSANIKEDDSIKIYFDNDSMLFISLKPEDYVTVEAAMFDDKPNGWWVW